MKDLPSAGAEKPEPADDSQDGAKTGIARETKLMLCIAVIAVFWLMIVAASWGEAAEPTREPATVADRPPARTVDPAPQADDEYSFNWLDPDKKIYVLQNRRYLKAERAELSVLVGP